LENQFSTKKSGKANQEFCKTPLLYAFIRWHLYGNKYSQHTPKFIFLLLQRKFGQLGGGGVKCLRRRIIMVKVGWWPTKWGIWSTKHWSPIDGCACGERTFALSLYILVLGWDSGGSAQTHPQVFMSA
jgi:hypothetical protein